MPFLVEDLVGHDLVQVQIIGMIRDGVLLSKEEAAKYVGGILRAKVERIYLSRKEVSGDFLKPGAEIDFRSSGGAWGFAVPELGERALVFLDIIRGRLYQGGLQLLIDDISNEPYATEQRDGLWKKDWIPPFIRANTRPYWGQNRCYKSAIRLEAIESDIQASIKAIKRGDTVKG
jgi:hypothetical protein